MFGSLILGRLGTEVNKIFNSAQLIKYFKNDLLWHFGTPDDWWTAFQRALGPELVVNGGFDAGTTGWTPANTASLSVAAGVLRVTNVGVGWGFAWAPLATTAGKSYVVQTKKVNQSALNNSNVHIGTGTLTGTIATIAANKPAGVDFLFDATQATTYIGLNAAGNADAGWIEYDNISVREIDLSKIQLWQDPAGTLPVTGPGQTWGLLLDAKDGLARGVEQITDGDFSGGGTNWTLGTGVTVSTGVASSNGTVAGSGNVLIQDLFPTANKTFECRATVTVVSGGIYFRPGGVNGAPISVSGEIRQIVTAGSADAFRIIAGASGFTGTIDNISVKEIPGYHASQAGATSRPLFTCRYNKFLNTEVLSTQNVTTTAGAHVLSFTGAGTITLSGTATGAYSAGTHAITCTAGTLTATVVGAVTLADLRLAIHANTGKPYQRVTSATDMDQEGFPFYSWTDGIDDWASTPVIPLGTMGVSAITIATGVTKLSDAVGMVHEFGPYPSGVNVAGSFNLVTQANYVAYSKGSIGVTATVAGLPAPHKAVPIQEGDITNDIARLTINNGTPVLNSADQGTGTYTDQIRYLFRRGGTTLPFGGHWHGDTGIKRLLTAAEKQKLFNYYNRNVKAT